MATYTFDKIDYGGNTYVVSDSGALQLTGGQVTGPVTFGDSVSIDAATLGDLVVNGSASFTNNIQANTINGVTVGSSPKFTDTVTTISTTGSGNAITAISASNGALTATKGTTFLTAHNTYTISTTGTGNAVTAVSLSGTTFTVTKGATYSNNAGTITGVTAGTGLSGGGTSGSVTLNHSNSVTAQTTQAVYPIKIDAQGHISAYGSAVTIPTDTNTWRKVQLNGTDKLGTAISTNPLNLKAGTNMSITESSGTFTFAATDTNTTYALSGALSSHKFTSTLTAGGSGSGTSTSDFTLAAGTGITITDDTSARKMTIACSVTNTDTKLQVAEVTSGTQYYPLVGTGTTAATRQYDTTGFTYKGTNGTTSAVGSSILVLGNATGSGTANNKQAQLIMYGSNTKKATITLAAPSADIALALPTSGGTLALTSQIPSVPSSIVTDVKISNISIVSNGVATIPTASTAMPGLLSQSGYLKLSTVAENAAAIQIIRW